MAVRLCSIAGTSLAPSPEPLRLRRFLPVCQLSGDREPSGASPDSPGRLQRSPAEEFSSLALVFRRRLLVGIASASVVAVGANFAGVTSTVLGLAPKAGRTLRLDVLYPIEGYSRCWDPSLGFEFIYPATWVGDQRLLYRAAGRAELERSLDPPPLNSSPRRKSSIEPVAAFGPPGSTGELNVSVIVTPVPLDFAIEAFGGAKGVGETLIKKISGSGRPGIEATLIDSKAIPDYQSNIMYYNLEFEVESPSFRRHNVAVCTAHNGRLFTLNAQTPESEWQSVKDTFYRIANSFRLLDM
ncbi:PsbP domain-containing protein 7 [Nymphaea thermarum]|nr:PsbP domain-containing protein 7 [Nymphaea thermarum]